jgi:hypothetical protein
MLLRFGFLDTDDISVLLCQPLEETFAGRRSNAIGVKADYAKQLNYSSPVRKQIYG